MKHMRNLKRFNESTNNSILDPNDLKDILSKLSVTTYKWDVIIKFTSQGLNMITIELDEKIKYASDAESEVIIPIIDEVYAYLESIGYNSPWGKIDDVYNIGKITFLKQ